MAAPTPLAEMSPNIQESEAVGRKRSHDEFADGAVKLSSESEAKRPLSVAVAQSEDIKLMPPTNHQTDSNQSPQTSPPGLVEDDNSTTHNSSPQTPSKPGTEQSKDETSSTSAPAGQPSTMTAQAPKRKRLTAAEKEAQEKEKAEKKKEREEQAAARAAEKARIEEEKAERAKERAKEREEKRKQKEEEDKIKAQEREDKRKKKEEEDKIKAQKLQEKEDKKRQEREAKEKKERQQPKLKNFFGAPSTPKKTATTALVASDSPLKASPVATLSKPSESEYTKLFKPFFLKENTTLALPATKMDEETREAKSAILDQFISGVRINANASSFDPIEVLSLPEKPPKRGRLHHPVKHIMEDVYKESQVSGADDAGKVIQKARAKLAKVPMKIISFSQDVRPPYYGTATFKPFVLGKDQMSRLARRSTGRRLPLEYDYDSEAEWQDDEGEDIDVDDDESDVDDEDDMDGFLDDSEDAGLARRVFVNTIEPDSSGICFEDERRLGPNPAVFAHKMEIMLSSTPQSGASATEAHAGADQPRITEIDPWSTAYWEPEPKPVSKNTGEKVAAKMPPPAAPTNAFAALTTGSTATSVKVVKAELIDDVKKAILENKALSKAGIVDFVFQQFRDNGATRTEVKNTIEMVAEKQGAGKVKEWSLKPGHEIST